MSVSRRQVDGARLTGLLAKVLGSGAVVLLVAGLWLARLNGQPLDTSAVGFSLPFATFAAVGTVLLWSRPRNRIGWVLLLGSLSLLLYGTSEEYARYGLLTAPGSLPGADIVSTLRTPLWVPGAASVLVFLPLLFPTGRVPTPGWRPLACGCGKPVAPKRRQRASRVSLPGRQRTPGGRPISASSLLQRRACSCRVVGDEHDPC